MKRMLSTVTGLTLGMLATAGVVGAQEMGGTRAVQFGIGGGATVPMGDFGDAYGTGFHLMGSLSFQPMAMPVGLRIDATWNSLGLNDDFDFEGADDLRVISGTANAVLTVANSGGIKPYVLGGAGMYNIDFGGESETKFGLNGGGGLEFPLAGFSTFVEARFHHVFLDEDEDGEGGSMQLVPIMFGIKF
jgi:opacity protein-like surface antigen